MNLLPTSEQQQIIEAASRFLGDRLPVRRLHDRASRAAAAALWPAFAEMGWFGLALDEENGGVGYTEAEEVLLFREIGRVLAPPEILFAAMAAKTAAAAGDAELAARIVSGDLRVALAVQDDFGAPAGSLAKRRLYQAEGSAAALAVDGELFRIFDLDSVQLHEQSCLDKSVHMSTADLSGARLACESRAAGLGVAGNLLTAAVQVGLAEEILRMTVEYAKIRHTFGRPIGAYQAVRHPCAEMAARTEQAKSLLLMAARAKAEGSHDAVLQAAAARVLAEQAALHNAEESIQLHGGIGLTDEFDAHFFLKRANIMTQWFGQRRAHLASVLEAPVEALGAAQ